MASAFQPYGRELPGEYAGSRALAVLPERDPLLSLVPSWTEFALTLFALTIYALASSFGGGFVDVANYAGPAVFTAALGYGALKILKENQHAVLLPILWYRVASGVYLGAGSIIVLLLNDETRRLVENFFSFYPDDVLKYNAVVAFFHLSFLCMSYLIMTFTAKGVFHRKSTRKNISRSVLDLRIFGIICVLIGATVNYGLVYPNTLGIYSFTLPTTVSLIGQFAYIGYFILIYWSLENGNGKLLTVISLMIAFDSLISLLSLSKYQAIFPVLMAIMGIIYHRFSIKRTILIFCIAVPFYNIVSSFVEDARSVVARNSGGAAVLSDTIAVYSDRIFGNDQIRRNDDDLQLGLARFSYVNAGTFAINQYDQNIPGDSVRDIFVVWIPRFIYPDKPIITDIAREFTFIANGNYDSSTSPSVPAEGYWNFGWLGVVMFAILVATILSLWTIYSWNVLQGQSWHLLFVVLLGVRCGQRIDGALVPDFVGPISAAVSAHIVLELANRFLPALARSARNRSAVARG